jgi:hypothetical protein
MLCEKYGILIKYPTHIAKARYNPEEGKLYLINTLMDIYNYRKSLYKISPATKCDENYFRYLKNKVKQTIFNDYCLIETIHNETLRNTVDRVIKENYKNIYILDYCDIEQRNSGANGIFSACVRNLEDEIVPLHEIEIFKPYIFRNSISIYYETIPNAIFGIDMDSLFNTRYFKVLLDRFKRNGELLGKKEAEKAVDDAEKELRILDSSIISEYITSTSFEHTSEFLNLHFKDASDFMNRETLIVNKLYGGEIFRQLCNYVESNGISKEWIQTWYRNFSYKFKLCTTCGSSINTDAIDNFCKKCGNKINYINPFTLI